jgi:thiol:disulfide interchange protein DsbD
VSLHIALRDGWHTYWKNPGDSGIPTRIKWTLPEGWKASDIYFPAPEREAYAGLMNFGYSGEVDYLTQITPPATLQTGRSATLQAKASWLICKDICIPEEPQYTLALATNVEPSQSAQGALVDAQVALLPKPYALPLSYEEKNGMLLIRLPEAWRSGRTTCCPDTALLIKHPAPQEEHHGVLSVARDTGALPDTITGLMTIAKGNEHQNYDVTLKRGSIISVPAEGAAPEAQPLDFVRLVSAAFFAFLGGIILNLMPCVFPVLSLKALSIAGKAGQPAAKLHRKGFAYAAGVIVSFLLLALVLAALRAGGASIGWGYQMQSPLFVGLFVYVLMLVGLNLSGVFELPMLFGNVGHKAAGRDTVAGSFFTGVLAVAVATPCTAPFMAPAIGYALTRPDWEIVAVFLALGAGMALPMLIVSLLPKAHRLLPKPGVWLLRFRELMAFPMYLSAVWLLWVLGLQVGVDMLMQVMMGLVLLALALWVWKILPRRAMARWLVTALIALGACYPLTQLPTKAVMAPQTLPKGEEHFSMAALTQYRAQKTPVFVDATAAWCLSCKVNERLALSSNHIRDAFRERGIVYMVADWTRQDPEITQYLASFHRAGVPLYVYYPPEGDPRVLPQLLSEQTVLEAIK